MLLGGHGNISVTANVAPRDMSELCKAALAADAKTAREIHLKLLSLHKNLFIESNPIPAKWALQQLGRVQGGIRLPLTPLDARYHEVVRRRAARSGFAEAEFTGFSTEQPVTGIFLTDVDIAHVPGTQNQAPRSSFTKDLMKRSALSLHATRMAALALALVTLAGCDTLNDWFASDRVNYKGAGTAPPLNVPSDLQAQQTQRNTSPAGQPGASAARRRVRSRLPAIPPKASRARRIRSACTSSATAITAGWWSTAGPRSNCGRRCRNSGRKTALR
jgi:hypothetical protein